jgi:vancomycin resistance protein YoaR
MIHKIKPWLQPLLIAALGIPIILAVIVFAFQLTFWQKIYPNIKVAQIPVGGKNKTQALLLIQPQALKPIDKLTFAHNNLHWQIPLAELNFNLLPQKTISQAYLFGRTGNFKKDFQQQLTALTKGINLNYQYQINQQALNSKIASISAQINKPPIPPEIQIIKESTGSAIIIQPGQRGQRLQQKVLSQLIDLHLSQLQPAAIKLPVKYLLPEITEKQLQDTKKRAEKLLKKELILANKKQSWTIGDATLIDFLDFQNGYTQDKIASYAAQIAKSIDRQPENALFTFIPSIDQRTSRVQEFKPSQDGQKLNQQQTIQDLISALKDLESSQEPTMQINLPVEIAKPQISNQDVNNLGIKELIGRGESYFRGSISARIHNIQNASRQINGLLVAPNEVFSLNNALGDVSVQTGYQKAWIIKEGRTVLGDGGGVCQVSTTLFRAALDAGLPIEERRAHDYRVSYYEQNYQVGVDATVYSPHPDLKFKNDTPAHILIQTDIDTANMKATYSLYGTADGRIVAISPSRIWDQTPPPPALYQDDPTLPPGVVKQIDFAAWGAKTSFDWTVKRGGEVLQKQTFYSNYRPWQAVFLRGTKQ